METITIQDALTECLKTIQAAGIAGMRAPQINDSFGGSLFVSFARARGVEVTLNISNGTRGLDVDVTWPSTGYSPAAARAAAVLHGEVADLACLLEATIQRMKIEVPA